MELSVILPHIEAQIFASDSLLQKKNRSMSTEPGLHGRPHHCRPGGRGSKHHPGKISVRILPSKLRAEAAGFLSRKRIPCYHQPAIWRQIPEKLSVAALETLAIIAYEQRLQSEIELIKVNCIMPFKLEKELIVISGRRRFSG